MLNKYKGWYIGFFGNGYRLIRAEKWNGKTIVKTASTIAQAKTIINNCEFNIKNLGHT